MKSGWLIPLAASIMLSACTSGGDTHAAGEPTFPPAAVFKDGLLYAAIKARLAGNDIDSTTRISVSVHSGVVTLSGTVADAATKNREAKLVREMRGVKSVVDAMRVGRVGPSAAQTVSDAALLAAVESSLAAQAGVNVTGIAVHVNAGTVTLAGHAPTSAIKSTLVAAAWKTPGVRNVIDHIAVKT